jgi:hypothetical protein
LNLFRFQTMRTSRGPMETFEREAGLALAASNHSFFERAARILKNPGKEVKHIISNADWALLDHWAFPFCFRGKNFLPLCCFSNRAIAQFLAIGLKMNQILSDDAVRKKWTRLGLRKARTITVKRFSAK